MSPTPAAPHPRPVLAIAAGVLALSMVGALLLHPAHRPLWLSLLVTQRQEARSAAGPVQTLHARTPAAAEPSPLNALQAAAVREVVVALEEAEAAGPPAPVPYGPPGPAAQIGTDEGLTRVLEVPVPAPSLAGPPAPPPALGSAGHEPQQAAARDEAPEILAAREQPEPAPDYEVGRCELESETLSASPPPPDRRSPDFGRALAAAAQRQTADFVVYTDKYRKLAYPMGDVPALFGVCTDVVIRAYRALGVDLQARIHAARIGSSDPSIAHRRTFTLRRYFASRGASLPISDFAEDYLPGDIVTYHRPQNSGSRDHIAIVALAVAPSGRPMIVHNRGWGPQIEDALFVDKITGHYRYRGQEDPMLAVAALRNRLRLPLARLSLLKSPAAGPSRRANGVKAVLKARQEARRRSPVKQ